MKSKDWLEDENYDPSKKAPGQDDNVVLIRDESPDEPAPLNENTAAPTDTPGNMPGGNVDQVQEDDKKLVFSTSCQGYAINGRVLSLVVKKRSPTSFAGKGVSSQQMMENWVSTQVARGHDEDVNEG